MPHCVACALSLLVVTAQPDQIEAAAAHGRDQPAHLVHVRAHVVGLAEAARIGGLQRFDALLRVLELLVLGLGEDAALPSYGRRRRAERDCDAERQEARESAETAYDQR